MKNLGTSEISRPVKTATSRIYEFLRFHGALYQKRVTLKNLRKPEISSPFQGRVSAGVSEEEGAFSRM